MPFEGDTPFSVAVKHTKEPPIPPKKFNPQIPEDLNRLILRCLEKDRIKRYQTAHDLLSDLSRIEGGVPTAERVLPKRKPLTSREITVRVPPKKLVVPILAAIVLVIAGLIIWRFVVRNRAGPALEAGRPSLAILYFTNNTGDKSLDFWRTALSDLLITNLS